MWQRASLALLALALVFSIVVPVSAQENDTAMYWFMNGYNLYYEGRYNESLEAYSRALELNSSDSEAWNNKGIDEGLLGRYAAALSSFENAVAINSTYAEAWYNMGVIYDMQGDSYNAVQAYKKATQINPEYQKAWVRRNVNADQIMARSLSCACHDQITYI
jgi:tetratricopeptide (TPR) repeat protein